MAYLLDANVFIQAKNLHYGLDFCPAFWEWLIKDNAAGQSSASRKSATRSNPAAMIFQPGPQRGPGFFLKPDAAIVPALGAVSTWATGHGYEAAAVNTFLQVADYYLVAHALAHKHTVVTHEIPSDSKKKIKIPNACLGVGLKFMTPYEMLRHERARFVLGARP
jgi:hypothetical protein